MTTATKNRKMATLHRKLTGKFLEGYERCPGCPGKQCDRGKMYGGYCGGTPVKAAPEPTFATAETTSAPEWADHTFVGLDFGRAEESVMAYFMQDVDPLVERAAERVSGFTGGGHYTTGRMAAHTPNPHYAAPTHHGRPDHIDREDRMHEFRAMYGGTVTGRFDGARPQTHELPSTRTEELARLHRIVAERGLRLPTAESLLESYEEARARDARTPRFASLSELAARWGVTMREYPTQPITITIDSAAMMDLPDNEAAPEHHDGTPVVPARKPRRVTPPRED